MKHKLHTIKINQQLCTLVVCSNAQLQNTRLFPLSGGKVNGDQMFEGDTQTINENCCCGQENKILHGVEASKKKGDVGQVSLEEPGWWAVELKSSLRWYGQSLPKDNLKCPTLERSYAYITHITSNGCREVSCKDMHPKLDLSYAVVAPSSEAASPANIHGSGVCHALSYPPQSTSTHGTGILIWLISESRI